MSTKVSGKYLTESWGRVLFLPYIDRNVDAGRAYGEEMAYES
jgi:hypothetical protein